jgi:hypothetical protein
VAEVTLLFVYPLATANASMVVVVATGIGALYVAEAVVGAVPLVV